MTKTAQAFSGLGGFLWGWYNVGNPTKLGRTGVER
jgi:hypothetical protein